MYNTQTCNCSPQAVRSFQPPTVRDRRRQFKWQSFPLSLPQAKLSISRAALWRIISSPVTTINRSCWLMGGLSSWGRSHLLTCTHPCTYVMSEICFIIRRRTCPPSYVLWSTPFLAAVPRLHLCVRLCVAGLGNWESHATHMSRDNTRSEADIGEQWSSVRSTRDNTPIIKGCQNDSNQLPGQTSLCFSQWTRLKKNLRYSWI